MKKKIVKILIIFLSKNLSLNELLTNGLSTFISIPLFIIEC